jgi:hypothetical protein
MPTNPDRDARVSPAAPYRKPSLAVYGKMTDLTETGMGSGKEVAMDAKKPITLSNP